MKPITAPIANPLLIAATIALFGFTSFHVAANPGKAVDDARGLVDRALNNVPL